MVVEGCLLPPASSPQRGRHSHLTTDTSPLQLPPPPPAPPVRAQVTFHTKVWHPQIALESGKPCVDLLKEQWKPTLGLRDVLSMLRQLLASPSQSACAGRRASAAVGAGGLRVRPASPPGGGGAGGGGGWQQLRLPVNTAPCARPSHAICPPAHPHSPHTHARALATAADSVNSGAAAEMAQGIDVFDAHAKAETTKYAMD